MYGITDADRLLYKNKLEFQRYFLNNNYATINNQSIAYSNFYFSSWHNPQRYIAELNNRVTCLNRYANDRGLKCIFAVFTLPTEYHEKRVIKSKDGFRKLVRNDNYINDDEHSVKSGSNLLTKAVRSVLNSTVFREIPKSDRVYITTKEPHKDGTCHLNFMCFVPQEYLQRCINAIKRRFLDDRSKIETSIQSPTSYIMKYILKTLDDLRNNPALENLTDITYWYLKHKIRRVTMSQTFVSLEIYRKLNGRIDLISLTKNYNKGLITVLIDPDTKKPLQIFDEFGDLWHKVRIKSSFSISEYRVNKIPKLKTKEDIANKTPYNLLPTHLKAFSKMSNFEIVNYYLELDKENMNVQRLAIMENEMLKRNLNNFTHQDKRHDVNDILTLKNEFVERGLSYYEF